MLWSFRTEKKLSGSNREEIEGGTASAGSEGLFCLLLYNLALPCAGSSSLHSTRNCVLFPCPQLLSNFVPYTEKISNKCVNG